MRERGFIIDKITNSIEEVSTGRSFPTVLQLATKEDIKGILKKNGWFFNWKKEYNILGRQVYKLLITGTGQIQGLISFEPKTSEQYIEMHLIENAPHNLGSKKHFFGVAPNMVAFACKTSFDMGFEGFVAFMAKTKLIKHYMETLNARLMPGHHQRMVILPEDAKFLVNSYFKNELYGG